MKESVIIRRQTQIFGINLLLLTSYLLPGMRVILNAVKNLLRIQTNIINMGILLHRPIVIST